MKTRFPTVAALIVALAGPPLFVVVPTRLFGESPSIGIQLVLQLLYCGLAGFIVWIVLRVEHLPLQSIATIAFALAHIPWWGVGFSLGADLPFGILMTTFYLWKRNLPANILAHAMALLVGILTV